MSQAELYYTAPLAILRGEKCALTALEACVAIGIVNAGIGFTERNDDEQFEEMFETALDAARKQNLALAPPKECGLKDASGNPVAESRVSELWEAALVGWKLLNITGGNRLSDAQCWLTHHRPGEVFFRISNDWLWGAVFTARREAGGKVDNNFRQLSWREFRILAAILSSKVNTYDFTFIGWEMIQARACGYHSKATFNAGKSALPAHCQPLSRSMIRDCVEKLEGLGFFARCRYSKGQSGGLMAYSFRHPRREDLQEAVLRWSSTNESIGTKTAAFREADRLAFEKRQVSTKLAPSHRTIKHKHQVTANISSKTKPFAKWSTKSFAKWSTKSPANLTANIRRKS